MDKKELKMIYENYLTKINEIWRSLWPIKKRKRIRKVK